MAVPRLGAAAKPKRLLADKAYDADRLRRWLKQRRIRAAIPSTASRRTPYPLDRAASKRRNVIERLFCTLNNWRRVATRSDRLARNSLSGLALTAIIIASTELSPQPKACPVRQARAARGAVMKFAADGDSVASLP